MPSLFERSRRHPADGPEPDPADTGSGDTDSTDTDTADAGSTDTDSAGTDSADTGSDDTDSTDTDAVDNDSAEPDLAYPEHLDADPTYARPSVGDDAEPPGPWDLQWYDDEAGPVVRPYAMTRGRTRPVGDGYLDLLSIVTAAAGPSGSADVLGDPQLAPEHLTILDLCRREPFTVAEIGSITDLPLGVVRVLLGDLDDMGLVRVTRPVPPAQLPDESILREVINGLRAL
jgi:hypothetical protein